MKVKIVCGILALLMITVGVAEILPSDDKPPVYMGENPFVDTPSMTLPEGVSWEDLTNTIMEKPESGDPSTLDPKQCLYISMGVLEKSGGFRTKASGGSTSMGISQAVSSERTVVGDTVFKQSVSCGAVSFGEQLYINGDKYLSRDAAKVKNIDTVEWADFVHGYTEAGFLGKIGYRNTGLTGYVLNDQTILDAKLEKAENGLYTFRYVLDVNTAPFFLLYEMRNNAGSSKFAKFFKAEIIVTMDSNFVVQSLTTDAKYEATAIGLTVTCTESLTETFFDIGYNGELPNAEFFETNAPIVDNPVQKEPTALDVLMGMFGSYLTGGEALNASVKISDGETDIAELLVNLKLNMEELENTSANIKIGDELYITYTAKELFLSYQDFKARTTLDGIMELVNQFMPQGDTSEGEGSGLSVEALTEAMSYTSENGNVTVNIPLELGEIKLNANLFGTANEDGSYTFTKAEATLDDLKLDIALVPEWSVPEITDKTEYAELLGITDQLIDESTIIINANLLGISADVMFDVATKTLSLKAGDLNAVLLSNTLYATLGEAKVKFDINDINEIIDLIKPLLGENTLEMPSLTLDDILAAISSITATTADGKTVISLSLEKLGLTANITLKEAENKWQIENITVALADLTATVSPSTRFETPQIGDAAQYVDITDVANTFVPAISTLVNAKGFEIGLNVAASIEGKTYSVVGNVVLDANKNIAVDANILEGDTAIANANVIYANNTVFLDVNGIKLAFAVGTETSSIDLSKLSELNIDSVLLKGIISTVEKVIDAVKNLDPKTLDIAKVIESLTFENATLNLVANADFLALGTIDVSATACGNNLTANIKDFEVAGITLNANASVVASDKAVTVPNTEDYILNLKGNLFGIDVSISADIANMDIAAKATLGNNVIDIRLMNDTVYAKLGEVTVKLSLNDIMAVVKEFTSSQSSIDINKILQALSLKLADEKPSLGISLGDIAVAVNFNRGESISFENISLTVKKETYTIAPSAAKLVSDIDTTKATEIKGLVDEIIKLVKNYINLEKGIAVTANGEVAIGEETFNLAIALLYNNGLHANVVLSNASATLLDADVYYINNNIYLEANGIRAALNIQSLTELISSFGAGNTNKDALLADIKTNEVLGEIVSTIENLMNNYKNINLADILKGITENQDKSWTLTLDASSLKLGDSVSVTLKGNEATICGLKLGTVALNKLTATLGTQETEVVAPVDAYITQLSLKIGDIAKADISLDLLNMTAYGTVNIWQTAINLSLENNTVYLSCGDARLSLGLKEIPTLIDEITKLTGKTSNGNTTVSIADILNNLTLTTKDGLGVTLAIGSANIDVAFDGSAKLSSLTVTLDGTKPSFVISASLAESVEKVTFDTANAVNVVSLLQTYAANIKNLISAKGFEIGLNGDITAADNIYSVDGSVKLTLPTKNTSLALQASVALSYKTIKFLDASIWLVDNMLYAEIDDLKLAISLNSEKTTTEETTAEKASIADTLNKLRGYNAHLDVALDVVQSAITTYTNKALNLNAVLGSMAMTSDENATTLTANINGTAFGASTFAVELKKTTDKLAIGINNLAIGEKSDCGKLSVSLNASVAAYDGTISAPEGDWKTNILVQLDDNNTLYGRLDLVNMVFDFKLVNKNGDSLDVKYADKVFKVKKGTDIKILGNIDAIKEIVNKIDEIVKAFAGTSINAPTIPSEAPSADMLKGIVNSLAISVASDEKTVVVALEALGMPVTAEFTDGMLVGININIDMLHKVFTAKPSFENMVYDSFTDNEDDYIAIETVLNDFMPHIDTLIKTNCWRFDFKGDAQITIVDSQNVATILGITQGSYVEFFYNRNNSADFTLCGKLIIQKSTGENTWQQLATVELLYTDGRIYITYNDDLRLTVSIESIKECASAFESLKQAIPQIGDLITKITDAMNSAGNNLSNLDYTSILKKASYAKEKATNPENNTETIVNVFSLVVNGGVILDKIGDINLVATDEFGTLTLRHLSLSYDNISLSLENLTVNSVEELSGTEANGEQPATENAETNADGTATETVVAKTPKDYAIMNDVNGYFAKNGTAENHISFDSLEELLLAVSDTAQKDTFAIDGIITAKLNLENVQGVDLSGLAKLTLPLSVSARVDIVRGNKNDEDTTNDEDKVYITIVIVRPKTQAKILGAGHDVYADKDGGQSYIFIDTSTGTITTQRYAYSYQKSSEAWSETEVYDHCVNCGKDAVESCYVLHCTQCGRLLEETEKCKEERKEDWCKKCNTLWEMCSNKGAHIWGQKSKKTVPAHYNEKVEGPHTINTLTREVDHKAGENRAVIDPNNCAYQYQGSTSTLLTETVNYPSDKDPKYQISRLENELYELINLGELNLVVAKLDLENLIVEQIHKDNSDATDVSPENLLGNLQKIFLDYKYVEQSVEADGKVLDPYFKLTADLSPINKNFGVLDLSIGHTLTEIRNEHQELVKKNLNLTYLRGTFSLASVLDLEIKLTLQQNAEAYKGDATYFVTNTTPWTADTHAPKN